MMFPLLAIEASPEMITAAVVLSGLAVLATSANALIDLWRKVNGTDKMSQPVRVQAEEDQIGRREFDDQKGHVSRMHRENTQKFDSIEKLVRDRFDALDKKRHDSIQSLHQHIAVTDRSLREEMKQMEGRMNDRFKEGNHNMSEHDKAIAALQAVRESQNKGGRP